MKYEQWIAHGSPHDEAYGWLALGCWMPVLIFLFVMTVTTLSWGYFFAWAGFSWFYCGLIAFTATLFIERIRKKVTKIIN